MRELACFPRRCGSGSVPKRYVRYPRAGPAVSRFPNLAQRVAGCGQSYVAMKNIYAKFIHVFEVL